MTGVVEHKYLEQIDDQKISLLVQGVSQISNLLTGFESDEKVSISYVLGGEALRLNNTISYVAETSQLIIKLTRTIINRRRQNRSIMNLESESEEIRVRLVKCLWNIKELICTIENITSDSYKTKSIIRIVAGLVLVGAGLASFFFFGGDAWLILVDAAVGGAGISLIGRGIKTIMESSKSIQIIDEHKDSMKKLGGILKQIQDKLGDCRKSHAFVDTDIKDDYYDEAKVVELQNHAIELMSLCDLCPTLPDERPWYSKFFKWDTGELLEPPKRFGPNNFT